MKATKSSPNRTPSVDRPSSRQQDEADPVNGSKHPSLVEEDLEEGEMPVGQE